MMTVDELKDLVNEGFKITNKTLGAELSCFNVKKELGDWSQEEILSFSINYGKNKYMWFEADASILEVDEMTVQDVWDNISFYYQDDLLKNINITKFSNKQILMLKLVAWFYGWGKEHKYCK